MKVRRLYLYYINNGTKIKLKSFHSFNELMDWSNKNCTKKEDSFFFNGNRVLCAYHLPTETKTTI